IPHVRRSLLPGFHIPRVLWMTGQKSLPVLVLGGETIHDSTRIIERLERLRPEPALYPADDAERRRALALEDFFDEELGPHVRRALFHELLPERSEEHTSELQSRRDLVCRLLLEKKKKKKKIKH